MRVSNISKLVPHAVLRRLFSLLGPMLCCDIFPNVHKKDGTLLADIVYANLSDAALALRLGSMELGDRTLSVALESTNAKRLNATPSWTPRSSIHAVPPELCRTLLALGANVAEEPDCPSILSSVVQCWSCDEEHAKKETKDNEKTQHNTAISDSAAVGKKKNGDGGGAYPGRLLEYADRETMLKAMDGFIKRGVRAIEVQHAVDPDARMEELSAVMMYGVPMSILLAAEKKQQQKQKQQQQAKETASRERSASRERRHSSKRDRSPSASSHRPVVVQQAQIPAAPSYGDYYQQQHRQYMEYAYGRQRDYYNSYYGYYYPQQQPGTASLSSSGNPYYAPLPHTQQQQQQPPRRDDDQNTRRYTGF